MKVIKFGVIAILLLSIITACSENPATKELNEKDTNKAQAKVDNQPAGKNDEKTTSNNVEPADTDKSSNEPQESKDFWTYYDNAKWSDDFGGLKSEVIKVVVSDKAPQKDDEKKKDASVVGVKFRIENTTDGIFTTYPDQAVLVTSTGEQIDSPEMFLSDHIGGEVEKGVIKEGNVIWYLKRGHAEDITWIKLKWYVTTGDGMDMDAKRKEYAVELKLK